MVFRPYSQWKYVSLGNSIFVSVLTAKESSCQGSSFMEVGQKAGFIASMVTEDTGCGGVDTPWLITVKPGHRLNFTLWDFALGKAN